MELTHQFLSAQRMEDLLLISMLILHRLQNLHNVINLIKKLFLLSPSRAQKAATFLSAVDTTIITDDAATQECEKRPTSLDFSEDTYLPLLKN